MQQCTKKENVPFSAGMKPKENPQWISNKALRMTWNLHRFFPLKTHWASIWLCLKKRRCFARSVAVHCEFFSFEIQPSAKSLFNVPLRKKRLKFWRNKTAAVKKKIPQASKVAAQGKSSIFYFWLKDSHEPLAAANAQSFSTGDCLGLTPGLGFGPHGNDLYNVKLLTSNW